MAEEGRARCLRVYATPKAAVRAGRPVCRAACLHCARVCAQASTAPTPLYTPCAAPARARVAPSGGEETELAAHVLRYAESGLEGHAERRVSDLRVGEHGGELLERLREHLALLGEVDQSVGRHWSEDVGEIRHHLGGSGGRVGVGGTVETKSGTTWGCGAVG